MIAEIETIILSTIQTIYDAWGWFGVAAMLIFENATPLHPVKSFSAWRAGC